MQLVKKGKKIWAGVPPPPPFRAMPKRKHFFFREGFPYGYCHCYRRRSRQIFFSPRFGGFSEIL